jgi:hypothetical protein
MLLFSSALDEDVLFHQCLFKKSAFKSYMLFPPIEFSLGFGVKK